MTTQFLVETFEKNLNDCSSLMEDNPDHISWEDAVEWTERFRNKFGEGQLIGSSKIQGYNLSSASFKKLIGQDGHLLPGIRVYFGIDERGVFRVIIVASDKNGVDDYKVPATKEELRSKGKDQLPEIGEVRPCPECGKSNVLNS